MHATRRSVTVSILALLGAVVLGVASTLTSAVTPAATTALIMGGTGTPNPADFPGYIPNVANYYIYPNTSCLPDTDPACDLVSVFTPETAWPLYGGSSALTWKDSILAGVDLFDAAVQEQLADLGADDRIVLFGYSQSGAILAFEKIGLANNPNKNQLEIVAIGNVSRPNGGLNPRVGGFSIPIVEFPFGPTMPTDTGIPTTDIALKWDIIADAPLYVTNPLAMFNALLGGPGFGYVHGTYPDPSAAGTPDGLPGGYTPEEWQDMMDNPQNYPDIIDIQTFGDTKYITVTPKVLPLVQPLHAIGLTPLADLIEPALRVIIEQTGYDRSISPGQPTSFRLIPIFNPITLVEDLAVAIPEGIEKALAGLGETTVNAPPATPSTLARTTHPSTLAALDTVDPAATTPAPEFDGSVSTLSNSNETGPATPKPDPAPTNNSGAREAEATTGTGSPTATANETTATAPTDPPATKDTVDDKKDTIDGAKDADETKDVDEDKKDVDAAKDADEAKGADEDKKDVDAEKKDAAGNKASTADDDKADADNDKADADNEKAAA